MSVVYKTWNVAYISAYLTSVFFGKCKNVPLLSTAHSTPPVWKLLLQQKKENRVTSFLQWFSSCLSTYCFMSKTWTSWIKPGNELLTICSTFSREWWCAKIKEAYASVLTGSFSSCGILHTYTYIHIYIFCVVATKGFSLPFSNSSAKWKISLFSC